MTDKPLRALAMPLFSNADPLSAESIVSAWTKLAPGGPELVVTDRSASGLEISIDGRAVLLIHIPKPIPGTEALDAVKMSWMWQQPDTAVREHQAHAIVTAAGSGNIVTDAWDVVRVSAALLASSPAGVALYWGNARQVHTAKTAIMFASENDLMPVPIWVGVTISAPANIGPFSAATHGLEALGHREFEVRNSRMPLGELRTTLLDLAAYVLSNGPVLLHGETFGPSADVKWNVTHEPSTLVPGRQAIVLAIP
jgi:hypothetical protein